MRRTDVPAEESFGPGDAVGMIALLDGAAAASGFRRRGGRDPVRDPARGPEGEAGDRRRLRARFYRAIAVLAAGHLRSDLRADGDEPADDSAHTAYGDEGLAADRMRRLVRRLDPGRDVVLTGDDLTIDQVARVAWQRAPVRVADSARKTMRRSRDVVERPRRAARARLRADDQPRRAEGGAHPAVGAGVIPAPHPPQPRRRPRARAPGRGRASDHGHAAERHGSRRVGRSAGGLRRPARDAERRASTPSCPRAGRSGWPTWPRSPICHCR